MVFDSIPQSLPVHFFGSRPQPPTSPEMRFCIVCVFAFVSVWVCEYVCVRVCGCRRAWWWSSPPPECHTLYVIYQTRQTWVCLTNSVWQIVYDINGVPTMATGIIGTPIMICTKCHIWCVKHNMSYTKWLPHPSHRNPRGDRSHYRHTDNDIH